MPHDLPDDPDIPARIRRLRELGLGDHPDPEFDIFAHRLAEAAQTLTGADHEPIAMVNFVTDRQYFAGLYIPPDRDLPAAAVQAASAKVDREMPRDQGYCPYTIARRRALVLGDVCASPRFSVNYVVGGLGVRSYIGTPVFDPATGMIMGTICVIDRHTHDYGKPGLELIKTHAGRLTDLIARREHPPT